MRLTEIAKDAVEKVRAIFRKPDQEKEKKAEAAEKMIRESGELENAVIGCDLAAGEDQTGTLDIETARRTFKEAGYDFDEVTKAIQQMTEQIVETVTKAMRPFMEAWKRIGLDKWQITKMEMPNNERRRRKIPMVRRRAHLRAEKNAHRRAQRQ